MNKNIYLIFGMLLLISIGLTSSYTAPPYSQVNMSLCTGYTAPAYNQINITLGSSDDCNTCTCPSINTNWVINMSDYCNITTNCNLGTGNLSFTNNIGWCNVSATINTKSGFNLYSSTAQTLYLNQSGNILIG